MEIDVPYKAIFSVDIPLHRPKKKAIEHLIPLLGMWQCGLVLVLRGGVTGSRQVLQAMHLRVPLRQVAIPQPGNLKRSPKFRCLVAGVKRSSSCLYETIQW